MNTVSAIGATAALLTTVAYVPQAYKTIKTRSTASLSLPTYIMLFLGTCLWEAYGLLLDDVPGSDDVGPVPLGADICTSPQSWQTHDLEHIGSAIVAVLHHSRHEIQSTQSSILMRPERQRPVYFWMPARQISGRLTVPSGERRVKRDR